MQLFVSCDVIDNCFMPRIKLLDKEFTLYLTTEKIQAEVQAIADRINNDLKDEDVVFMCVLNGAFMFASDLVRKINFNAEVSFVKLTSYKGIENTGLIKRLIGINEVLKDRTIVIVEDIVDTGSTIESIVSQIRGFRPRQIYIATMLVKPDHVKTNINFDYVGFRIPADFVIGYGLDYKGYGRNLRNIYKLDE